MNTKIYLINGQMCILFSRLLCVVISLTLAIGLLPSQAFAVTENIYAEADAAQQKVEETARVYEECQARISELENSIEENSSRIEELQEAIPEQQQRSGDALSELYKLSREGNSLIDLLLSAESFMEALGSVDFLNRIFDLHWSEIEELLSMKAELEDAQAQLTEEMAQAKEEESRAVQALAEAQAAREMAQAQAQAAAEEEARKAAEEAAAQEEAQQEAETSQPDTSDQGNANGGSTGQVTPPTNDNADWSADKAAFVASWAGRIDAYLAGSPLSGYGTVFAEAAWDYGVDPRFSPAISCVESSKGAACFRPHNAWGWGSVSWGSWEEAIAAHVCGLARGYGYTLTVEGAKKYCPPNWEHWYNRVAEEMNRI